MRSVGRAGSTVVEVIRLTCGAEWFGIPRGGPGSSSPSRSSLTRQGGAPNAVSDSAGPWPRGWEELAAAAVFPGAYAWAPDNTRCQAFSKNMKSPTWVLSSRTRSAMFLLTQEAAIAFACSASSSESHSVTETTLPSGVSASPYD
jgi:hypothetical protein